jgi:RsiW-degrading membrane proteinase PrsW (M82 family)
MGIKVTCTCGKRLLAKESLAGKRVKCPACGEVLPIPGVGIVPDTLSSEPALEAEHPPQPADSGERQEAPRREPIRRKIKSTRISPRKTYPDLSDPKTSVRRHLHWLLVLALIPLAFSLLQKDKEKEGEFKARLIRTMEKAPQDVQLRVAQILQSEQATLDDLLRALPNERLDGAHLSRKTWMHWLYAGLTTAMFFGFLLLIAAREDANPLHLLGIGFFTGTIGILFLLAVQFLAEWTQGYWVTGRSILVIFFYIAKFIGFSYRSALDPDNNFFLSFFGFTCGVGFCEELCKALPLLCHYRRRPTLSWRGALLWGLASGVGFGIAEGIMYSRDYYNGIGPAGIYVVRFVSCVALHAIWSASVGITLDRNQALIQGDLRWFEFIPPLVRILGVAMVLHGLYDTLLKKEMNALGLIVAVASFLWLAWQIGRVRGAEAETPAPAALRA